LDGHSSDGTKNDFDYEKWSYQAHIIPWLDQCIKESARIPAIRETIYQYQQILKKMCGMLQNENEAMELNDLLKKDFEHFEAANNIHEQFKKTKYDVKYKFWDEIKTFFTEKYKENLLVEFSFLETENYPHIIIGHQHLKEWYVCFCVEWLQRNPYYGLYLYEYDKRSNSEKTVIKRFKELHLPGFKTSDWWFSYKHYNNIDFSTIATLSQTFSTLEKQNLMHQIVEPIDKLIKENGDRILEINSEISLNLNKESS